MLPQQGWVLRGEAQNSNKQSMTSGGSLLVHHLYFSSRHLDPVSERSSKGSQSCTSVVLGHSQHPWAQCQPSHTSSSCAWSNKSVGFSLGFHSFSCHLFTGCLHTTISTRPCAITFRFPAPAQAREDPFVLTMEEGEHLGTKRGRGSESHGGRPVWNPTGSESQD